MFWISLYIIFVVWFVYANRYDGLFFGVGFGILIGAALLIVVMSLVYITTPTTIRYYTVDIYSATSKDQLHGNFVFGSGSINSVDKYSTFIKSGNGKKKYTFDASPVTIIEDNKITPHVTIQYEKVVVNWWTTLIDMKANRNHKVIEMVVPEGSVTTSFNIE